MFEEVERGNADFGVVPVENTTEGGIIHTLDTFLDSDLKISAEIALEVNMCLLARAGVELTADRARLFDPRRAGPVPALAGDATCRARPLVESRSTADGARLAHDDARGAAVGSEMAAKLYELVVLRRKIEDLAHNMTRFLVLGREQAEPTGRDKTSLLLVTRDEPGILYRVLGAFAAARPQHDQDREPPLAPPPLGVRLLRRHRRARARRAGRRRARRRARRPARR